jgi:hypothetical protein
MEYFRRGVAAEGRQERGAVQVLELELQLQGSAAVDQ